MQNHYEICSCEYGYQFKTSSGNNYLITFIPYPAVIDFLEIEIYMFNIERIDNCNHDNGDEQKVRNTIIFLIKEFFNEHKRALITLCDVLDGKQLCRHRLFNRWFNSFNDGILNKIDSEIEIDSEKTFASLLYRRDLKNDMKLKENFGKMIEENFYN